MRVEKVAGGWRFVTRPEFDSLLRKFHEVTERSRLSLAALETLAIIAYRQPITLPEIQDVRGVNSSSVLKTLFEKKLITTAGKKPVVGTPFFYRTTQDFLVRFGLNDLAELPKPEDLDADLAATVEAREIAGVTAGPTAIRVEPDPRARKTRRTRKSTTTTKKTTTTRRKTKRTKRTSTPRPSRSDSGADPDSEDHFRRRSRLAARGRGVDPRGTRQGQRPAWPASETAPTRRRTRSRSTRNVSNPRPGPVHTSC